MKMGEALRLLAGFMVLLSLGLAVYIDIRWLWLTAFVGWCPAIWFFRKIGLKEC